MLSKRFISLRGYYFSSQNITHSKICIIGGGTGGLSVAAQLLRKKVNPNDIRIFQPSDIHYYQPGFTMIGSKLCKKQLTIRKMQDVLPHNVPWTKYKVTKVDPQSKIITAQNGQEFSFQHLVFASGLQLNWNKVKGAEQLLDNPNSNVCSIYNIDYAQKTARLGQHFHGGKAIFMEPPMPIKCAGAPQKILYLWTDTWHKKHIPVDVQFIKAVKVMFSQPKYAQALSNIAKGYNIKTTFGHNLIQVHQKVAIFQNVDTKQKIEKPYNFLHIVPSMSAHDYIKQSGLSDQTGFLDINKHTLVHTKYQNIWGVGDCTNLPTSKTAAAAFSQCQVLVENLASRILNKSAELKAKYYGYTSCPLFVGDHKLMLAQFKYDAVSDQTFFKDQEVPRKIFYYLKKDVFPQVYWNVVPRGLWQGRKGIRF